MYSNSSRFSRQRRSTGGGRSSYGGGSTTRRKSIKQNIHPSKFIKVAKGSTVEPYQAINSFADFDISPLLMQNIVAKGYLTPSPIQDQTIPLGLKGQDIVGIANTGTGKTAAFALPMLNAIINDRTKRGLVIAPTRELAEQIEQECRSYAKNSGIYGALLIGGSNMSAQYRDLKNNPEMVIGTPGRIKDHCERGTLNLSQFNIVVLDEVDRMLDMGFINDIRFLLAKTAPIHQSFFFSATMEPKIAQLINSFSNQPVTVSVKTGDTSDLVHQDVVYYLSNTDKIDKLHDILVKTEVSKTLIFDETKRGVERLGKELEQRGFKVDSIHGDRSQGQRTKALRRFKNSEVNVLVATDVAARGIDVVDISHVINYSTPNTYDDYSHRIGRAGRAGNIGYALTFITR